jgi:hypothetical protein
VQVTSGSGSYYRWKNKQSITMKSYKKIAIKEQIILIYFESMEVLEWPQLRSIIYKIQDPSDSF